MSIDSIFQSFPELVTDRLVLRRIILADSIALFGILSDEEVTRFYDDKTFTDVSQASMQIEAWENGYQHRRYIRWAIILKEDPKMISSCSFDNIHPWHLRASLGYELVRPLWRKAIMTEALNAIIALGFNEMGLLRIDAVVLPTNTASVRLLDKLGFLKEGMLRNFENWGDKGLVDLGIHSITRRDWELASQGIENQ
jgi:ribosomal-protein-alanine N-acetyltransferase